jgi:cytochrome c biogenesis protein
MNWLNYLSSVKLTLVLLILIVVTAIVGTIIPHESDNQIYVRLQLNDVYHSYWYMALLVLFCINLCLCSIKNIPVMIKSLKMSESKLTELNKLPFYKRIDLEAKDSGMFANSLLYSFTRKLFYKLKYSESNNHYYFERGRISRFGPMITHASIIVIVIGGLIVSMTEFKGNIRLPEGGVVDVPNSDFKVQAEDFRVEFYPNSETPKDYVTKLSVIDKGETVLTKDVRVNHPLKYKGISFLQSDYGFVNTLGIKINKKVSGTSEAKSLGEFKIDEGQTIDVSGTDLKVTLKSYIPDFVIDEEHNVHNRSSEPRNPAILLELTDGKSLKEQMWLFLRFPGLMNSKQSDYMMEFISIYPPMKYYTGLQVRRNPGMEIVWTGSLMIICGLLLSFYTSHKRLWMRISSDSGKNILEIGGRSYKSRSDFDRESSIIAKQLGVK